MKKRDGKAKCAARRSEEERLLRALAQSTRLPGESVEEAMAVIAAKLPKSALLPALGRVGVLRHMWGELKGGKAHETMNRMIAEGRLDVRGFEAFERAKGVLRDFQRRARALAKGRETKRKGALETMDTDTTNTNTNTTKTEEA